MKYPVIISYRNLPKFKPKFKMPKDKLIEDSEYVKMY